MVIVTVVRVSVVVMGVILGCQKRFVNGRFATSIPCRNERAMEGICNFLSILIMLDSVQFIRFNEGENESKKNKFRKIP